MEIATVEKYMTDDVCLTQACIQERVSSTREPSRDDKLEGQIIHCVRSLYNSTPHHFSLYGVFKFIHFHKYHDALKACFMDDENLWIIFV